MDSSCKHYKISLLCKCPTTAIFHAIPFQLTFLGRFRHKDASKLSMTNSYFSNKMHQCPEVTKNTEASGSCSSPHLSHDMIFVIDLWAYCIWSKLLYNEHMLVSSARSLWARFSLITSKRETLWLLDLVLWYARSYFIIQKLQGDKRHTFWWQTND